MSELYSLMKRIAQTLAVVAFFCTRVMAADSVVVFNEMHYHPTTNETVNEWVELHNQMAVDIDLSAWRLEGAAAFTFVEGTIIPGGGYLVIAANPAALQLSSGATNVLGPFTGRLNNSGARLELRDRNDRLMDRLDYRGGGKWPLAPDGSGATLAKRDENASSNSPENWTSSILLDGTPGRRNFPQTAVAQTLALLPINALWRYEASGTDLGSAWRAPGYDDTAWSNGSAILYAGTGDVAGLTPERITTITAAASS